MAQHQKAKTFLIKSLEKQNETQETWRFWYIIPNRSSSNFEIWDRYLKPLLVINSIEDFYTIFKLIDQPFSLPKGCRYYVFRNEYKGIEFQPYRNNDALKPQTLSNGTVNFSYDINMQWEIQDLTQQKQQPAVQTKEDEEIHKTAQERWEYLVLSVIGSTDSVWIKDSVQYIAGIEFTKRGIFLKIGIWTFPISEQDKNILQECFCSLLKVPKESIKAQKILCEQDPLEQQRQQN